MLWGKQKMITKCKYCGKEIHLPNLLCDKKVSLFTYILTRGYCSFKCADNEDN